MKRVLLILSIVVFTTFLSQAKPIKVMLVTGGHAFDTLQFFKMFDELNGIEYKHFLQPNANGKLVEGEAKNYDVLVFYDMWKTINEDEKQAYIQLTEQGKPFLFLHHSLVSYQDWPEFEKIVGGKYIQKSNDVPVEKQSTYKHDVWVEMDVVKKHMVTKGFKSFKLFDEVYGNYRVSDKVTPLITTNHPESTKTIAWENKYNSSKIVYLQPGHDHHSFDSKDFRKLMLQAIKYLAKSK